ncbi:hypothetical protein PS691_01733 [Pseudomonas fluorescens]|uniref:Uncharacterized protein n=1 Tax=Pseudomonas fluorescens TaxID=294 RepID=A0A5E7BBF9_PSEFL|nr:hypothetical protein PS691_01733 [Pseudomonas fluorescens]
MRLLRSRTQASPAATVRVTSLLHPNSSGPCHLNVYAAQWVKTGDMQQLAPLSLQLMSPFDVITRRGIAPSPILRVFLEDLAATARNEVQG